MAWEKDLQGMGSFFYRNAWLGLVEAENGFVVCRKAGVRVAVNPPFTPYCDPRVFDVALEHADLVMLNFSPAAFPQLYRVVWNGGALGCDLTFVLNIRDMDAAWKKMDGTRRRNIRRARRDNVITRRASETPDRGVRAMLALYEKTFARQRRRAPFPKLCEKIMWAAMHEGWGDGWIAYDASGTPIAFAFFVWDSVWAYYLFGGYDHARSHHGAGPLAMWSGIESLHTNGIEWLDFEGSHVPSIGRYFQKYGGVPAPVYTVRHGKKWARVALAVREVLK